MGYCNGGTGVRSNR